MQIQALRKKPRGIFVYTFELVESGRCSMSIAYTPGEVFKLVSLEISTMYVQME